VRRVAAVVLLAVSIGGCSWSDPESARLRSDPIEGCPSGSEWPQTGDAAWLRARLERARLAVVACSGSAYVVRLPTGGEVYVWSFAATARSHPRACRDAIRVAWARHGHNVWVEAGPTASKLPSASALAPLVAATVR
jgi:hypothetical protein